MSSHLPHFTSCADVLERVYEFLDAELPAADCAKIQEHLDECGPCLKEFGLDRMVKEVVKRGCGCEPLPEDLRERVMVRIREVQIQIVGNEEAAADQG